MRIQVSPEPTGRNFQPQVGEVSRGSSRKQKLELGKGLPSSKEGFAGPACVRVCVCVCVCLGVSGPLYQYTVGLPGLKDPEYSDLSKRGNGEGDGSLVL